MPPLISYARQAFDFVQNVTGVTKVNRIATLAYIFIRTGLLTRTGDPVLNASAGGSVSFVTISLNRRFTWK